MNVCVPIKPFANHRPLSLALAALIMLASCGDGGGGVAEPKMVVKFEDGAILGALVTDSSSPPQTGSPVLEQGLETGNYSFVNQPVLPIRLASQNLLNADFTVKVANVGGVWVSYLDTNQNGSYDAGEQTATLTYQDLDGNRSFTQGVDIPYTGQLSIKYVPAGATTLNGNPVTALIPTGWDGVQPVAGLSAELLAEAASVGLTSTTTTANNTVLNQVAALLTAVAESLVANGLPPSQLEKVVASVASSAGVDLRSTDAASTALAQAVVAAVPDELKVSAGNSTSIIQTISVETNAAVTTSGGNYEALVKIAQSSAKEMATADSSAATALVAQLSSQVTVAATSIQENQSTPGVDPDAALNAKIAALRLVPNGEIEALTKGSSGANAWNVFGSTTKFGLARQTSGELVMTATGSPWTSLLGAATTVTAKFNSSTSAWEYVPTTNRAVRIDLNFVITDPTTKLQLKGNWLRVCQKDAGVACGGGYDWYYFLADETQVCRMANMYAADMKANLLAKINAINVQQTTCP